MVSRESTIPSANAMGKGLMKVPSRVKVKCGQYYGG